MAADRKDPTERAKRMARLIIRDIVLYNKDNIAEAIKNDSLFDALEKELEEGRKYYEKNVDPAVASQTNYFDEAVVDILVKGQGDVASGIW
jgi:hypothetical protein